MCNQEAEVNNRQQYILHCKAARNLWNMFLCIVGVDWVWKYPVARKALEEEEPMKTGGDPHSFCLVDIVEVEKYQMF